jgi:CRP/FNR family cyclic AMP-dependent transcriptional regulator
MAGMAGSERELLKVRAGETVFRQGERGDTVYLVLDGKVELRVGGRLVETVGPGGILGEMALIEQAPRVATAAAKTACDLLQISEARFTAMIQQTPHFALQIMKVMAARLRKMNVRLSTRKKAAPRRPTSRTRAGRRPTSSR